MKFRLIAAILGFAMATWLPAAGQQPSAQSAPQTPAAQDSGKDTTKHSCCCSHESQNADADTATAQNHEHESAACCPGKDGKKMSCCTKDAKNSKEAMMCCKDKDAKLCASKDGKPCCNAKEGKSCCGKDAAASNAKAGKGCCTGKGESCCKHMAT